MFVFKEDDKEISILRDAEFRNLSDDEKLKYFWGPDEGATCNWIKDVIRSNDTGDLGLPEITERFVKEMFPDEWKEIEEQSDGDRDKYNELFDEFYTETIVDPDDEELNNKEDLFFINAVYDRSYFYYLIIKAARNEDGVKQTHKDDEREFAPDYYEGREVRLKLYIEAEDRVKTSGLNYQNNIAFPGTGIGPSITVCFPCSYEQEQSIEDIDTSTESSKELLIEYGFDPNYLADELGLRERAIPLEALKKKDN